METSGRILGLDYGAKTVGVAVSDPLGITAQGVETIRRDRESKIRQTLARIEELVLEYQAERIVLGYPKTLENELGSRAEKTLEFKTMLERRIGVPVELVDERFTTLEANRAMQEAGLSKNVWKDHVDRVAAMLILQSYLDRKRAE
ncbi:MAG: Holliday junction resolvase RuvX [Lachnospiraceae bacterium]|nr:Holliday junction resolvase RuvX [Lachnospiraceae bacterium]